MTYILGIDLGTTSMSALVFQEPKGIVFKASSNYNLYTDSNGKSEQNPNDWISALDSVMKDCVENVDNFREKLEAICVSGQMHSLVTLDSRGKIIRNAILWNDTRTSKEVETINKKYKLMLGETGNIALEGFTLPKILWIRNNEPQNFEKLHTFLTPKDYINYYLTGVIAQEISDASGTVLFNIKNKRWSDKIIEEFGLSKITFPKVVNTGALVGHIEPKIAEMWGVSSDIKIYAGAADNVSSALGVGIYDTKKSMLSIGTSGVYLSLEKKIKENDGSLHLFNFVDDMYYSMGVTLAAGKSLAWFKEVFSKDSSYEEMMKSLHKSPVGANGLLFTPYIQGERTPYNSDKIRGSFVGIDITHTKEDFTRSVIEGISYSLKQCQEIIMEDIDARNTLVVTGGGAKSEDWLQLLAHLMNQKVCSVEVEEGAALGSIIIALVSLGYRDSYKDAHQSVNQVKKYYKPDETVHKMYMKYYNVFKSVYAHTLEISSALK